uniref:Transmembrane protein n=1 Tax=Pithovirus LCPAC103 TaxID=2506588 RepID=A0A481Z6V3_9VIRU|nr:MAG: hypothetical protein LCPAC103_01320 [Pithovirus LCPAC103]
MTGKLLPVVLIVLAIFVVIVWVLTQFLKDLTSEKIGGFIDSILKSDFFSNKNNHAFQDVLGLSSAELKSYVKIGRELFD